MLKFTINNFMKNSVNINFIITFFLYLDTDMHRKNMVIFIRERGQILCQKYLKYYIKNY